MTGEEVIEDFEKKISEAERGVWSADHMVCVILPVVKDTKLLIRALEAVHKAVVSCVGVILKLEYMHKRINLTNDSSRNLELFFGKCASRYGLNEPEIGKIREIVSLGKRHKESGFEFSKHGRVIILDDALGITQLSADDLKGFIKTSRRLVNCTQSCFRRGL
jgi:hypothetical protein